MWEAIRKNNRRSRILISLMGMVLVGLGFIIGMTFDPQLGGPYGALAAAGLWLLLCIIALSGGDRAILASARAHKIEKKDVPRLWNVVEEMTIASGLGKMPAVYIVEDHVPNAFAVGRNPEKAAVAVTTGLLKRLTRDELQGVVAHEIGHIKNADVRFMTIALVMVGSVIIISEIFLRSFLYGSRRRSLRSSRGGQAQAVVLLVAILLAILAPLLARLLYFACSRQREYLADASAARFTRYPEGLASALEKISKRAVGAGKASRALAPLYIVNPLQGRSFVGLFSTHPPTERRIKILRSMAGGASFLDYERAYRKICGEKKRCIDEETIRSDEGVPIRSATPEPEAKSDAIGMAREVGDLLGGLLHLLVIPCVCGVRIKLPPDFKRDSVSCPRCGRKHFLSEAQRLRSSRQADHAEPRALGREGNGWRSIECSCGRIIDISPAFQGNYVKCTQCRREIKVLSE